ncbi:methyltransferase domain-containing protein [Actinocorallia aurantiaca]|uniref:Class I SAM-dependent methyltransferase n=1 Tax=Actinocorallia aurantiaca TaxID=46204 RepID=A0ABP6G9B7_9ACTN
MTRTAELPAAPWTGDDPFATAVRAGRGPLWLREESGLRHRLDVERWCGPVDAADRRLLHRSARDGGPVLDVGCGPGRLVAELLALGVPALGVDLAEASVSRTRSLGAAALCRSVFDRLPGEGRWSAALLADGNLGIGGDPARLFDRISELLAPGGLLLVEVETADVDERLTVRVEDGTGRLGAPFVWARLGADAAVLHAARAGFTERERWDDRERRFVVLAAGARRS